MNYSFRNICSIGVICWFNWNCAIDDIRSLSAVVKKNDNHTNVVQGKGSGTEMMSYRQKWYLNFEVFSQFVNIFDSSDIDRGTKICYAFTPYSFSKLVTVLQSYVPIALSLVNR